MRYFYIILLTSFLAGVSFGQWEKVAWENAAIASIIEYKGDLYCATGIDGVYRSTDAGSSWKTFNEGIGTNHFALHGRKLIATSTHFLLLCEAPYGRTQLFRREKTNGTWQHLSTSMDSSWIGNIVQVGADTLIAHAEVFLGDRAHKKSGIYISTDGGTNWQRRPIGLGALYYMKIAYHDSTLCISTAHVDSATYDFYPTGLFRSTDLGNTWIPITEGIPDSTLLDALESNGKTFFASAFHYDGSTYTFDGLYRSTDNGISWIRSMTGIDPSEAYAYPFVNIGSAVIVSMANDNYLTTDDGATWSQFLGDFPSILYHDGIELNGQVYLGTDRGILIPNSNNLAQATDISSSNDGFLAYYRIGVFAEENTVYANLAYSTTTPWIARSTDNGETWAYALIDESITMSAAPWQLSNNLMFAGGRNEDNGRAAILIASSPYDTWLLHSTLPRAGYVECFSIKGDSIFASVATESGTPFLYTSTNGGITWRLLDAPSTSREAFVVTKFIGNNLFIVDDYNWSYLSTNGGLTWRDPFVNSFAATFMTSNGDFALTAGRNFDYSGPELVLTPEIYATTDAGKTWRKSSNGIPSDALLDHITMDNGRPGIFYVSTNPEPFATSTNPPYSSVYVSANNGLTWAKHGGDLPQASRILVGSNYVFAASEHGLYRYPTVKEDVVTNSSNGISVPGIAVHPNPVSLTSTVSFTLPAPSSVQLIVYDLLGRIIRHMSLGHYSQGLHEESLDLADIRTGKYLLRLISSTSTAETWITKIQ